MAADCKVDAPLCFWGKSRLSISWGNSYYEMQRPFGRCGAHGAAKHDGL